MATGYGRTDARAMRQENERRGRWEGEYVLSQEHKHTLRFLPPIKDGPFFFKYFTHYLPEGSEICPKWTWRQKCPICALGDNLYHSRDTAEIAQGRKLYRKIAYIANVLDVRSPDDGVQFVRFGKQIRDQLVNYFADPEDPDDEGIDITDPEKGANIRITVVPPATPQDFKKYVAALGNQGPIGVKNWVKGLKDLEDIVKKHTKSFEELKDMVDAIDDAPGAEDDPAPARTSRRSFDDDDAPRGAAAKGNGRSLDEDEDNDDKPQTRRPAAAEEDDPPVRPAARTRPTPVEDDEPIRPARNATRRRFVEEADED